MLAGGGGAVVSPTVRTSPSRIFLFGAEEVNCTYFFSDGLYKFIQRVDAASSLLFLYVARTSSTEGEIKVH